MGFALVGVTVETNIVNRAGSLSPTFGCLQARGDTPQN